VTKCTQCIRNNFFSGSEILEPECKISRTSTSEYHDFSRVFHDPYLFPGLSRPGNLNILISGLSRIYTNDEN